MKLSGTKIRGLEFTDLSGEIKKIRSGIAKLHTGTLIYNKLDKSIIIKNAFISEELSHPRKYTLHSNGIFTDDFYKFLLEKINTFMINNNLNEFTYDLESPKNINEPIWTKNNEIKQYSKIEEFNNFSIQELIKLFSISINSKAEIVILNYLKWLWIDIYQLINNKNSENKFDLFKYFADMDLQNMQKFVVSDSFDKLLLSVFDKNWEIEVKQYIIDNFKDISKMFATTSNKVELWLKVKIFQENIGNNKTALTISNKWELSISVDQMMIKNVSKLWFNELIKNRGILKEQIEKDLNWELINVVFSKIKEFTKELTTDVETGLYTCIQWGAIKRISGTLLWDTYSSQKENDLGGLFDIFSDNFDLFKKMVENIKIYSINNYISLYKKHFFWYR